MCAAPVGAAVFLDASARYAEWVLDVKTVNRLQKDAWWSFDLEGAWRVRRPAVDPLDRAVVQAIPWRIRVEKLPVAPAAE